VDLTGIRKMRAAGERYGRLEMRLTMERAWPIRYGNKREFEMFGWQ